MSDPFRLDGKVVLVTGASSGIGRATSIVLSTAGARVILAGRRMPALEETRSMMRDADVHLIEPYELKDLDGIPGWLQGIVERHQCRIDGLVNCAGVSNIIPVRGVNSANINDTVGPNLVAALMILKGASSRRVSAEEASFVFIASVAGMVGSPGLATYAASKGGIIAMVRSAARELAPRRIRVNAISPGMVDTPMHQQHQAVGLSDFEADIQRHPLGLGQPDDIAHGTLYLLSRASRWVTGTNLVIDGGYSS